MLFIRKQYHEQAARSFGWFSHTELQLVPHTHALLNETPDRFLLCVFTLLSTTSDMIQISAVANLHVHHLFCARVTPGIGTSGGETSADGGSLSVTGRAARCTERENGSERGTSGGERAHEDAVGVAVAAAAEGRAETENRDEVSDDRRPETAFNS